MNNQRPYCLTVGGFDPTAGAGVLADCKTFEMLEVYGMAVISSNTLQTDNCFVGVDWMPLITVKSQLETMLKSYPIKVVKIGLVQNFEMLYQIIRIVKNYDPEVMIVWDPILQSSSGYHFHSKVTLELDFIELNCTVITPNWNEFEALWGTDTHVLSDKKCPAAVLIKGGHRLDKMGCDLLFENGVFTEIQGTSFNGKSKHGTGCVLSSAIAAYLAQGNSLIDSCTKAKNYVERFIQSNDLNLGYHYGNK
ncbi:MAG: hydroxymethylpyrimidine/phosphomethylpyrimidine kinase [Paludibacter sp.]|nr:hydroxymethylpyrimidine/phosphomethylpyrimidine kinase [Paludibacter sp.]